MLNLNGVIDIVCFFLFQDGEGCRFLAQESREGNAAGVPPRKVPPSKGTFHSFRQRPSERELVTEKHTDSG